MNPREDGNPLGDELRRAWHHFVDELAPLRPALHGYCRRLTRNVWDAEDLVQDTLLRAFGQWGVTISPIRDPRAYLRRESPEALQMIGHLEVLYRSLLILTFGGGTNEIQRDLISLFGLGFPRVPRM